jgi:predicted nucleotidyltransferase component of viral defense system
MNKIEFNKLIELALNSSEKMHLRPIIEKEILHYDILFCLKESGLLDHLTFQGGTSLRLCYGGSRFSEDLDFAGGTSLNLEKMHQIKSCIEEYLYRRYTLPVEVEAPEKIIHLSNKIHVHKWQIKITTHPERKDLPRQLIKIEIANIDAYSSEPIFLKSNYPFLPDSYREIFLLVESLNEIITDKIVAFVNTEQYIRYRDIWDLHFILQQGGNYDPKWLENKIRDYGIYQFKEKIKAMNKKLPDIIEGSIFLREMNRFLPKDIQEKTIQSTLFKKALTKQLQLLFESVYSSL